LAFANIFLRFSYHHLHLTHQQAVLFGFGYDNKLELVNSQFSDNNASCCYTFGYGSKLQSNVDDATCVDVDSGENKGNCCYGTQYSNGTDCEPCPKGANCSTVGSTLATMSMKPGFWRASSTTTDVRDCWLAEACGTVTKIETATTSRRTSDTTVAVAQANNDNTYCADGYKGPCKCMHT
jgi:hypothetical protein